MSYSEAELVYWIHQGCCPDCHAAKLIAGLRDGASQNVTCSACRQRFNVVKHRGQVFFVDRLGIDPPGGN
jgi:hypothetical protein